MRCVLYWMVMQLVLLNAAQAQQRPDATGLPHVLEYPLPHQTVLLEFNQAECQASVTEEYVIPDVPHNPSSVVLTMLFNAVCDLELPTADTVPQVHKVPREIIEDFLVSSDNLRMEIKFDK